MDWVKISGECNLCNKNTHNSDNINTQLYIYQVFAWRPAEYRDHIMANEYACIYIYMYMYVRGAELMSDGFQVFTHCPCLADISGTFWGI